MPSAIMSMTQNGETKSMGGIKTEALLRILEETNVSAFLDSWGPIDVLQVYDPDNGMHGVLVIDNLTLGPGIGGIRISNTVTPREEFQRARTATLTCALAEVDFGGAAAGIRAAPEAVDCLKLIRAFARRISPHVPDRFIAAPDLNTGQDEMRAFAHEVGDLQGATGKPLNMGGIPQELGVQGFGMAVAASATLEAVRSGRSDVPPSIGEAKVAIQGFDRIGTAAARSLAGRGTKIVALCDEWGMVRDPSGIDLNKALKFSSATTERQSLASCKALERLPRDNIVKVDCDVLLLTTANALLTEDNVQQLGARCIVEGVNSPVTSIADQILAARGTLVVPDLLAASAGVIASYAEHSRSSCERAFSLVESKIKGNTSYLVERSLELGVPLRRVAKEAARERLLQAMEVAQ